MRQTRFLLALPIAALCAFGCKKSNPEGAEGGATASSDNAAGGGISLGSLLGNFEGEIDVLQKDNKPGSTPTNLALFGKQGKLRFEVPEKMAGAHGANLFGPKAYVIFDSPAKKVEIVSDMQKQVLVVDLNKSGEQFKGAGSSPIVPHPSGGSAPQGPTTKIVKTGKMDTVAGTKCEYWDIQSDHREGTVCVAQEGASWFSIPMTGIPTEHLWAVELLDGKHFPMRYLGFDKDGTTEEQRIEITKIDKHSLPDTEFTYPPSYKVVDLGQMLAGLGAMPGAMPPGAMPGMMHGGMPPHRKER
jgi:hypothetical protein